MGQPADDNYSGDADAAKKGTATETETTDMTQATGE